MNSLGQESSVEKHRPSRLSRDAILFVLFWAMQFWSSEVAGLILPSPTHIGALVVFLTRIYGFDPLPGLLLITLMLYLAADLWTSGRVQFVLKLSAVWVIIIAFVIVPTLAAISYRHSSVPYLYIHDGALQIEEAIKFLLAGKNPYVENYLATPMAQWPFYDSGLSLNPALYHFIYLPFLPIFSIPFYFISLATLGWFDERFVYLILLLVMVLTILNLRQTLRERLEMLMILTLNPLFVPFFIEGRNDIVVSFFLISAILFIQHRRIGWAGVSIVCAAASKQTIWFLLPFFALYLVGSTVNLKQMISRLRPLIPAVVLFAVLMLPFVFWNFGAFIDDIISYQAGTSPTGINYPIKTLGLGGIGLGLGWIAKDTDPFPYIGVQIVVCTILLGLLLYWQWHNNTLVQMLMNFGLLFFVYGFLSRVFNDNHLGFALTWLILPTFVGDVNACGSVLNVTPRTTDST